MTHNGCGVGTQQIGSNIRAMRGDNHHIGRNFCHFQNLIFRRALPVRLRGPQEG